MREPEAKLIYISFFELSRNQMRKKQGMILFSLSPILLDTLLIYLLYTLYNKTKHRNSISD